MVMSLLLKKVFNQSVHDEYTSLFPQINLISITSVVCLYSMRYKYEGLFWPIFGHFVANLRTFWCIFTGRGGVPKLTNMRCAGLRGLPVVTGVTGVQKKRKKRRRRKNFCRWTDRFIEDSTRDARGPCLKSILNVRFLNALARKNGKYIFMYS